MTAVRACVRAWQVERIKSRAAHTGRINCLLYYRDGEAAASGGGVRAAVVLSRLGANKGYLFSGASDRAVKVGRGG